MDSTTGIVTNLSNLINTGRSGTATLKTTEIELESRTTLSRYQWLTLHDYLSNSNMFRPEIPVRYTYESYNVPKEHGVEVRNISIVMVEDGNMKLIREVIYKTKISTINNTRFSSSEYPIQIHLSKERVSDESHVPTMQKPNVKRVSSRWNFRSANYLVTLMNIESANNEEHPWVLEVEVIIANAVERSKVVNRHVEIGQNVDRNVAHSMRRSNTIVDDLLKFTVMLYTKSIGSQQSYSKSDAEGIKRYIDTYLQPKDYIKHSTSIVPSHVFNKAIDLTTTHLSVDYMIRGDYRMTVKADGERKLMIFLDGGVYLVSPYDRINKISKWNNSIKLPIEGCVLDGEILTKDDMLTSYPSKWTFFVIDCLIYRNNEDIRMSPKTIRMQKAHDIVKTIQSLNISGLEIVMKQFYPFYDPESFYTVFTNLVMKDEISRHGIGSEAFDYAVSGMTPNSLETVLRRIKTETILSYKSDGIILEPFNVDYYRKSRISLNENHMPILKWKPQEVLTVDLFFEMSTGKVYASNQGKNDVLFTGTTRFPFSGGIIFPDTAKQRPFDIVREFVLYVDQRNGSLNLKYYRDRMDKELANNINVARKVWASMNNPLSFLDVTGYTTRMMTSYHNMIKRNLLTLSNGKILLDIGSGKGADIDKWYKSEFDIVYAVEPDPSNFAELIKRLTSRQSTMTTKQKLRTSVIPINHPVQNTGEIIRRMKKDKNGKIRKIDTISLFNSTTYFWKDKETFDSLINVITDPNIIDVANVKILTLSLDGDRVIELMWPRLRQEIKGYIDEYETNLYRIQIIDWKSGKIRITIKGTLVQDQIEWLPVLGNLTFALMKHGIIQEFKRRADKQLFLSESLMELSSLYSYSVYRSNTAYGTTRSINMRSYPDKDESKRIVKDEAIKNLLTFVSEPFSDHDIRDLLEEDIWGVDVTNVSAVVPKLAPDNKKMILGGASGTKTVPKTNPKTWFKVTKIRDVIPVQERVETEFAEYDDILHLIGKYRCRESIRDDFKPLVFVYRVGCIQTDLSLLHSVLKATSAEYRSNRTYLNRRCTAFRLYKELVENGYHSSSEGYEYLSRKMDIPSINLLSSLIEIEIVVVQSMSDNSLNVLYMDDTRILEKDDTFVIVINYTGEGYELIGTRGTNTLDKIMDFQTLFVRNDGLLSTIRTLRTLD